MFFIPTLTATPTNETLLFNHIYEQLPQNPGFGRWTLIGQGPTQRYGHTLVYDDVAEKIILFGGLGYPQDDNTWEYDGQNWMIREVDDHYYPSPRLFHDMVYDSDQQVTVLFGGYTWGTDYDITWELDDIGWKPVHNNLINGGPLHRYGHAMAYDEHSKKTVLFGGEDDSGFLGDTWEWDSATEEWTLVHTYDSDRRDGPCPRRFHAMTYDPNHETIVLFGGKNDTILFNDLWEWDSDSNEWTQPPLTSKTRPSPRCRHEITFNPSVGSSGEIVLFGGATEYYGPLQSHETWRWNGHRWQQIHTRKRPLERDAFGMAYDKRRETMVLYGGFFSAVGEIGDVWEFTWHE